MLRQTLSSSRLRSVAKHLTITVAEASADAHAGRLVRELLKVDPTIQIEALGGSKLRDAGATLLHETVSKSAMGLKAFARAAEVRRWLTDMRERFKRQKPDLHICCDSWTMNKHFAELAKSMDVPVLYYIAPQAWASRESRVNQLARLADRVACILPFEERWFRDRGVKATFVGHPLFDELKIDWTRFDSVSPTNLPTHSTTIALPCGSRRGVAQANFPRQLEVARLIRREFPQAHFIVPTTDQTHDVVVPFLDGVDFVHARKNAFDDLLPNCDLAITTSGTATLHIAAHGVPMLIVYAGNPLLWHSFGKYMIRTRTFGLVNLLANQGIDDPSNHICPEFIPWYGSVEPVARQAIELLKNPSMLMEQKSNLRPMIEMIATPGASQRVTRLALDLIS